MLGVLVLLVLPRDGFGRAAGPQDELSTMCGQHSPVVEMGPWGSVGERQLRALISSFVRNRVESCRERFGARVMLGLQPRLVEARPQPDHRCTEGDD